MPKLSPLTREAARRLSVSDTTIHKAERAGDPMICSLLNLLRFIRPSLAGSDATEKWRHFRGAWRCPKVTYPLLTDPWQGRALV
jgi:hypothetical protein